MAGVMADLGSKQVMLEARANWNSTALKLHLFKNNHTPAVTDTISDYTESTFAGYAAVSMTTWTAAAIASHIATMTSDTKTFTRSTTGTAENVYGYYVTDNGSTILLWAERDPLAPIVLTNSGDSYTVTPSLAAKDDSV